MATARGKVTSIHCGFPASEFQHVSGSPSIALPGPYSFELRCRIDDARMLALSRDDNNDVHAVAAIRAGNILHDTRFSCVSGRFVLVCALGCVWCALGSSIRLRQAFLRRHSTSLHKFNRLT